jgi:hypothetical protein
MAPKSSNALCKSNRECQCSDRKGRGELGFKEFRKIRKNPKVQASSEIQSVWDELKGQSTNLRIKDIV